MATLPGTYIPSTSAWVRDQVELYERTGGKEGNTLLDTGMPVIIVTMRGAKSGNVRKIALMRVEHNGVYALVASRGGSPTNPDWYQNLLAHPNEVLVQDGPEALPYTVRDISGDEYNEWWQRSAEAFPQYNTYKEKTDRIIPILLAEQVK
jgi:deazaflavin-dependent oxidoreductase (nitroreductase family)